MQIGYAYLEFALDETNFFRCMLEWKALRFMLGVDPNTEDDPKMDHLQQIRDFFALLSRHAEALDNTTDPTYFLQNALLAWSAIHGFTVLAINGPMSQLPREQILELFTPVVAGAMRGMDFKQPSNVYSRYSNYKPQN